MSVGRYVSQSGIGTHCTDGMQRPQILSSQFQVCKSLTLLHLLSLDLLDNPDESVAGSTSARTVLGP